MGKMFSIQTWCENQPSFRYYSRIKFEGCDVLSLGSDVAERESAVLTFKSLRLSPLLYKYINIIRL